jgi:alkylation response protein AidB-like acyl-CoA dehydrogenase
VDIGAATPVAVLRGADAEAAWTTAHLLGTIFDAAQLVGLAARMNEIAVAYALERKQFGKAIGSNQAVKHLLADVMVKLEFARPVVYAAAATLAPLRVAHAAVAAADAADRAARTAIHIHGAMGPYSQFQIIIPTTIPIHNFKS